MPFGCLGNDILDFVGIQVVTKSNQVLYGRDPRILLKIIISIH